MVLSDAIKDYGSYSRCELGHTESTYHSYVSWQRNFAAYLAENGLPDPPISEVTATLIRRYAYALAGRNLRPRTIRGALHALRGLFGYLVEMRAIPENPAKDIRLPKMDAATRLLVTDEDLQQLLEATSRQASDFRCVRDRAVLSVLIFCGLRRQELLDLSVQAVNVADGSLLVQQGKGKKARQVPLCVEVTAALREWVALRGKYTCGHDYLFINERRQRFGENSIAGLIEEMKAIAGFKNDPRIKPHSIRHAAATRLLRNGADIRSIQAWLGHSTLQTTAMYLHTDEEQVRKIAPLAGFKTADSSIQPPAGESRAAFLRRRRTPNK